MPILLVEPSPHSWRAGSCKPRRSKIRRPKITVSSPSATLTRGLLCVTCRAPPRASLDSRRCFSNPLSNPTCVLPCCTHFALPCPRNRSYRFSTCPLLGKQPHLVAYLPHSSTSHARRGRALHRNPCSNRSPALVLQGLLPSEGGVLNHMHLVTAFYSLAELVRRVGLEQQRPEVGGLRLQPHARLRKRPQHQPLASHSCSPEAPCHPSATSAIPRCGMIPLLCSWSLFSSRSCALHSDPRTHDHTARCHLGRCPSPLGEG